MATILHLIVMWIAGSVAVLVATFRRLLLGPTLPSWSWRTEWAIAFVRAVLEVATRYQDDPGLFRAGLLVRTPVPLDVRGEVDVRRVKVRGVSADRYMPSGVFQPKHTMLYFHGGGYVFGNPGTHRQFVARIVAGTGLGAVAPRYRLAPHHRHPAAVDDAFLAYLSLLDAGMDPRSIIVAGDSAGGGLAMALLHRLRREGVPLPSGAMLFSPYLDLEHTAYTITTNAATDYLPLSTMSRPNDWYAEPGRLADPEVSPIHADLTGFPPLLVFAGGAEMILGDSLRLAEKAKQAEVDVELVIEPEMMHVWPAVVDWEPASKSVYPKIAEWLEGLGLSE